MGAFSQVSSRGRRLIMGTLAFTCKFCPGGKIQPGGCIVCSVKVIEDIPVISYMSRGRRESVITQSDMAETGRGAPNRPATESTSRKMNSV